MRCFFVVILVFVAATVFAQYHPAAGLPGSNAVYKDSSLIKSWATHCSVTRGPMNISDAGLGNATIGSDSSALGSADIQVVSLGDGGSAVVSFSGFITNGPGYDFVVFENSFSDTFLELAFVEVSSDGLLWFRFPSVSLTQSQTQVASFGTLDPTLINNFAGKYRMGFGTPFDLEEMKNIQGLDITKVSHIKIIDVVGNILSPYASYDSQGHIVNDPWPTAFESSGFDLDAVGAINFTSSETPVFYNSMKPLVFPTLVDNQIYVQNISSGNIVSVLNELGVTILKNRATCDSISFDVSSLSEGMYYIKIESENFNNVSRFLKIK